MSEERNPKDLAESAIDRADRARERDNESAWFVLAYCALRLFAIFVSSYMKRER